MSFYTKIHSLEKRPFFYRSNSSCNVFKTIQDTYEKKSFTSKRSLASCTNQKPATTTMNKASVSSAPSKDGPISKSLFEEKLIRPSISCNLSEYRSHLQLSRHVAPETLSYELNYCVQEKHDRIPSTQCLLGCVIYIDEKEYTITVSKDDLSAWSKILRKHGASVVDDPNQMNLTHFVCAYRTSDLFRRVFKRGNVRMVTAHWLNDVLQRKKIFVPNLAIHYPALYTPNERDKLPLTKASISITGFEGNFNVLRITVSIDSHLMSYSALLE